MQARVGEFKVMEAGQPRKRNARATIDAVMAPGWEAPKAERPQGQPADRQNRSQFPRVNLPSAPRTRALVANPSARAKSSGKGERRWNRLGVKCAVCGGLLVCILMVKAVDSGFTNSISASLQSALTYEVSLDDALGKLKFVEKPLNDLAQVFAPNAQTKLLQPVTGEITETFDAAGHPYIAFSAQPNCKVSAAADGKVENVGRHPELGYFVQVRHSDGSMTGYYGLVDASSMKDKQVKAGETLGTLSAATDTLCFEWLVSDTPKDTTGQLEK